MSAPPRPRPVADRRGRERLRGKPPERFDGDEVTLQLAIAREGVGLELSGPVDLGAAKLLEARARLVGLRFPLDVSGGVERFRHRRTALEHARLSIDPAAAERWLATLAIDLLGPGAAEVRLASIVRDPDEAAREGLGARIEIAREKSFLAFDVAVGTDAGGIVAIAHRARWVGDPLPAPPHAIAARFLARFARAAGGRANGLRLDVVDPLRTPIVQAFVTRGARVPTRSGLVVSALKVKPESIEIALDRAALAVAPSPRLAALFELGRKIAAADEALVEGDLDGARSLYVRALESAPRHRGILTRLAEIDAAMDDRAEAALGWLREAQRTREAIDAADDLVPRTLLAASLHRRVGALGRARGAFARAGELAFDHGESRLAARSFSLAAACTDDVDPELSSLLDRALSADPAEASARWRRARLRVRSGDDARALEDVQHLEAMAHGSEARRATLLRAGALWVEAGRSDRAIAAYERALRYAPEDAAVVAGLGRAFVAAGEIGRGVALLARARTFEAGKLDDALAIDLARALAEKVGDPSAAIARLREVDASSPRGPLARALEGSYRGKLGDRVGADRAFAMALDEVERRGVIADDAEEISLLFRDHARASLDDAPYANRLALAAIAVAPHDPDARALLRSLGKKAVSPPHREDPLAATMEAATPSDDDESRAEALLAKVKGDPDDDASVDALVDVLARLGRDFELFALLSARFDDATPERRAILLPKQRAVLERLAAAAEAHGRSAEATLYRDAAAMLLR